jgi:phage gpG-like protein
MFAISIEDNGFTTRLQAVVSRASSVTQETMQSIGDRLVASVKENFASEGRPSQWIPSRSAMEEGRKTLTKTGRLANSPQITRLESKFVEVTTGGGLGKYPLYVHFGTRNQVITKRQRAFFWWKFKEEGRPMWKAMALSTTLKGLPARRFNLIQDSDVNYIKDLMREYLLDNTQFQTTIK